MTNTKDTDLSTKSSLTQIMVVNDAPGDECRIALLENDRLEELSAERTANVTNVGNIYKGRVVNVEPAIQAAFIDFGTGQNGFLHISDLHPRYFPGDEKTERVGKKIPRRERPPMQQALRRGQSILVQVIKEGVGTKGPTLSSYLSIPGRLMVMMPGMDRVGVSRRIEDPDQRREMRQVLDSLELPENMGFILRTAGFGRTKTELRRDLAYLIRLWKTMEKRIESVPAPCPLYVESDLLIRIIRDMLSVSIKAVIVDSESAHERAIEFLRVIAPRSAPKIIRYHGRAPIFHAFNIERQIDQIHDREVALPSGGTIVIEQTEALVAIDVNSGRSRAARDSETNAYQTNCEAADEICRQLRLRDLGGLVANDLIDMGRIDHRRAIEKRFRDNLARDRAKSTVTRISEFGVLEMTRQRMRPSMPKTHFASCTHCEGRGMSRTPESLASEAIRFVAYLLHFDRVQIVEVVCSPRLASTFLSGRRRAVVQLEDGFGKTIRIRVSDAMSGDRIDYYAYDERNADIDISALPALVAPTLESLEKEEVEAQKEAEAGIPRPVAAPAGTRRSRRRRGEKIASPESAARATAADESAEPAAPAVSTNGEPTETPIPRKKRRRRRRSTSPSATQEPQSAAASPAEIAPSGDPGERTPSDLLSDAEMAEPTTPRKKRRRRRRSSNRSATKELQATADSAADSGPAVDPGERTSPNLLPDGEKAEPTASRRKRRRRRRSTSRAGTNEPQSTADSGENVNIAPDADRADSPPLVDVVGAEGSEGGTAKTTGKKKRPRRRSRAPRNKKRSPRGETRTEGKGDQAAPDAPTVMPLQKPEAPSAPPAPPRRTLYRSRRSTSRGVAKERREDNDGR